MAFIISMVNEGCYSNYIVSKPCKQKKYDKTKTKIVEGLKPQGFVQQLNIICWFYLSILSLIDKTPINNIIYSHITFM